jgi:hypothetical protein
MKPVDVVKVLAELKKASVDYLHQGCNLHAWVSRSGFVSVQTGLPSPGPQTDFLVVSIGGRSPLTDRWLANWCVIEDLQGFLEGKR